MMSPKEFFRRWGEGIKALTPKQFIFSKIIMTATMLFGLLWASTVLFITGSWHFFVVIVAAFGLQVISLFGLVKQSIVIGELKESMSVEQANLSRVLSEMNKK